MNAPPVGVESPHISEEESRCLITASTEIGFLLRSIMKHNSLITAYFNEGREFILTSILGFSASGKEVLFDLGPDEELNQRLLASERLLFTTMHERVKVKFATGGATKVTHEGRPAIGVALPAQLVRMQRREYYRVGTGVISPLKCRITVETDGITQQADLTLLDISCGGIALIDQHHSVDLEPGNAFHDCAIALPGIGSVTFGLQVSNSYEITLRNGLACKRSGCRFVGISEGDRGLVQRYITQLERQQRVRGL